MRSDDPAEPASSGMPGEDAVLLDEPPEANAAQLLTEDAEGGAVWSFVIGGIAGLAWTVLDDRERYRMLKYLYVSPSTLLVMLLGRGMARMPVGGWAQRSPSPSASPSWG